MGSCRYGRKQRSSQGPQRGPPHCSWPAYSVHRRRLHVSRQLAGATCCPWYGSSPDRLPPARQELAVAAQRCLVGAGRARCSLAESVYHREGLQCQRPAPERLGLYMPLQRFDSRCEGYWRLLGRAEGRVRGSRVRLTASAERHPLRGPAIADGESSRSPAAGVQTVRSGGPRNVRADRVGPFDYCP